jgi:hypothetical protein
VQPDYLGAIALPTGRDTTAIMHADTVWSSGYPNDISKGEYNGTLSDRMFLAVRGGVMKSFWYRNYKSSAPRIEDISTNFVSGGVFGIDNRALAARRSTPRSATSRATGRAATTSRSAASSCSIRLDQPFRGFGDPCNCVSVFNNNAPSQVYLYQSPVNSKTGLWATTGLRERRVAGEQPPHAQPRRPSRSVSAVPARADGPAGQNFAAVDNILVWRNFGPRLGASYDISGKGKTVLKFNYGRYWLYPAADFANNINPNPATWRQIYTWRDTNANGRWDSGEQQGNPTSATGGTAATVYDPDIQNTYAHQVMLFVEHEAAPNLGVRTGVVWNGRRQLTGQMNINRPLEAYNVPVTVRDVGPDGRLNTADDGGTLTAYNLAPEFLSLPVVNRTLNLGPGSDRDYYTWEITATRRQTSSWSLLASFARTWNTEGAIIRQRRRRTS